MTLNTDYLVLFEKRTTCIVVVDFSTSKFHFCHMPRPVLRVLNFVSELVVETQDGLSLVLSGLNQFGLPSGIAAITTASSARAPDSTGGFSFAVFDPAKEFYTEIRRGRSSYEFWTTPRISQVSSSFCPIFLGRSKLIIGISDETSMDVIDPMKRTARVIRINTKVHILYVHELPDGKIVILMSDGRGAVYELNEQVLFQNAQTWKRFLGKDVDVMSIDLPEGIDSSGGENGTEGLGESQTGSFKGKRKDGLEERHFEVVPCFTSDSYL